MANRISHVTLYVHDQDEAAAFYTEKMGFKKLFDEPMSEDLRWVTVGLPGDSVELVFEPLAWRADDAEFVRRATDIIGYQELLLHVDDCHALCAELQERGIPAELTEEPWGIQATVRDLYGNMITLIQPPQMDA
ncbi:MAG: hypothetical protein HC911_09090 [Chloroflexaceae bacterium]|nr:hypothetical protein [Chloroflexaceae bacterium]